MRLRIQFRFGTLLIIALALVAACGSRRTEYVVATPVVVVVTATPEAGSAVVPTTTSTTPAVTVTNTASSTPVISLTPSPTPTVDPFPTSVNEQIIVAEQLFEHGRMFFLQPNEEIWVMVNGEDTTSGQWIIYQDSWTEAMPEFDPDIIAPEGLQQPRRGFGQLWRTTPSVRDALGWATDSEYGHVTTYQYFAGGEVTENAEYIPGPGYHTLGSMYGGTYLFDEENWTWRRAPGS